MSSGCVIIYNARRETQEMQILDLHNNSEQKQWIDRIRACDWGAAKFLAN